MKYKLRSLSTYDEYKACERLQGEVLGYEDIEILPYQIMQSFVKAGGAVIGAFDGQALAGAAIGYTGLSENGVPYHRSQRLVVLPGYRGQGIGEALKLAQAELARRLGLTLMCWTYDPLRSVNAHLNVHKLGATSHRYIANAYSATTSKRDAGVPIDRLWVEWDLIKNHATRRAELTDAVAVLRAEGQLPTEPNLSVDTARITVQIPSDIDAVKAGSDEGVSAWRKATSAVFSYYFARGYVVHDFLSGVGYVLSRVEDER
ncbi:MAG TPA: GNAT family N-acetyltransferase [Anaerolineae bacterium]|jgi:predicted GNAT superfamily acetyltransferase